ncbi:MAG: M24 family metallopeptidase [Actinomycetota bacterium]
MTTVTSIPVDLDALRAGRLARLQAAMRAKDVQACLLFNEPNVRYATGATSMPVYVMSTFARCAVVAQEGDPILFEHANSIHRSRTRAVDVRPMHAWEFYDDPGAEAAVWAGETVAALRELGVDPTAVPIAVDRLGTPGLLALADLGVRVRDAGPVTQEARRVKTPEEIALFELNAPLIHVMLTTFEDHLAPGVSERELLGEMARVLIARGGEYLATNTVCSGPNTNPWRAEATDRRVRHGDLVYVDTDSVAIEGCFYCVSRTFAVGEPTAAQRSTYAAAHEWVTGTKDVIRAGMTCAEVAAVAPPLPERFVPQRYECLVHGIGLEEENPSVCHPPDGQPNADTVLEPGTVLVVECYMGEVGGDHGVKLGDQVLVTRDGCRTLVPYPWSASLLG